MIFKKSKKVLSAFLSLAMIGTMVASVPFSASAADATTTTPGVSYSVHGQTYGWTQGYKSDGAEAGTDGQSKRVEALKVKLDNAPTGASITYQVHQQSYGWATSAIKSDDAVSGVVGQAKRDEAIRITLSGMPGYSVEYRVHQQTYGWSAWQTTANGTAIANAAIAGVTGKSKRVEALEVKLVAPTTLSVSSVTATSATALKVQFSGAVADTSKYSFKVIRGTTSTTDYSSDFTAKWSADKTYATLDYGANIPADTYTVTAASTGTDLSATANSGSTVVTAQTVTKISVVSKDLVKNSADNGATFSYKIYDQYGTDMTSSVSQSLLSFSATAGSQTYAVSGTGAVGTISPDTSTGVVTLTNAVTGANPYGYYASTDTTGVVTIVYATNGVNTSATMNLVSAASVSSVTFGANILPTGYTSIQAGQSTAVTIPITVLDQYGNTITDTNELGASLKLISSDSSYVTSGDFTFVNDANGNAEINVDASGLTSAETVVLTLVNTSTGLSWNKSLSIVLASTPTKIAVGDFSASTIAAGDSFALPLTVTDQFGNTMTKAQIASNAGLIKNWFTASGFTQGTYGVDIDPSSSTYGEFIGTVTSSPNTYVISFNSYGSNATLGNLVTKTVTVSAARVGTYVTNYGTINLMQGATKDLEFAFKDQYNAAIATDKMVRGADSTTLVNYTYSVTSTKLSGDTGCMTLADDLSDVGTATTYTYAPTNTGVQDINIAAAGLKTGSYKITVSLLDGTTTLSSATATVNVVENNVSGLTYSIESIPALDGYTGVAAAASTNPYAHEVIVDAKDASGNSYVVSQADMLSVTSSDTIPVTQLSTGSTALPILNIVGSPSAAYYVAGSDIVSNVTTPIDRTATITVLLNTQNEIQTLTKSINVSCAAPSITAVNCVTAPISTISGGVGNTSYANNVATDVSGFTTDLAYAIDGTTYNEAALTTDAPTINVIGEDQYGVWSNLNSANSDNPIVYANTTTLASYNGFAITGGKLEYTGTNTTLKNGTITATVTAASGISKQITVVVSGLDRTAPSVVSAVATDATHVTVTFSEALTAGTVITGNFGGTTVPSAVSYTAGSTTAVITVGNTTAGNTFTISTSVKDVAGNALASTYSKTF
jgi:uncharacterized protein YjdB